MKYEIKTFKFVCNECRKSVTMTLAENEIPPGWTENPYKESEHYCITCTQKRSTTND